MAAAMSGWLAGRPLVKASLTSGTIMALGDLVAQQLEGGRRNHVRHDWARTLRANIVGCTLHGPWFSSGMRAIDGHFGPSRTPSVVLKKMASSQALLFPPYLTAFFLYMGLLEGKSAGQSVKKLQSAAPVAFVGGMTFWPLANIINYRFVAPDQRILYVSAAGLIYQTFISWANSTYGQEAALQPPGETLAAR